MDLHMGWQLVLSLLEVILSYEYLDVLEHIDEYF